MSCQTIPICRQLLRTNAIVTATALLVGLALVVPITATAAPEISGTPEAVSVDAQHSSLKEILSGLHQRFDVQFQSTANLDAPLTGTYQGPLRQVLARLLAGYNFIIITKQGEIEVTVLGKAQSTSTTTVASNAPAIASSQASAQPVQSPQITAASPPSTPASKQEQQPAAGDQSLPSMPLIKAEAEGPSDGPPPVLTPSTDPGPIVSPATTSMPELKPSGTMLMPTTSTVTMPSGNAVSPDNPGTTNPPLTPAPVNPIPPMPQIDS
jgi:hypothetical protein